MHRHNERYGDVTLMASPDECDWAPVDGNPAVLRCTRPKCKLPDFKVPVRKSTGKLWDPVDIHRKCPAQTTPMEIPPLHRRLWSFAKAWTNHLLQGRPATPAHMRAQRLAICKACEFYRDAGCLKCGCPIADNKKWLDDKLSMAGQKCPVENWGPVELAPSLGLMNRLARIRAWYAECRTILRKFWMYARPGGIHGRIRRKEKE